jgi:hypothetical protein
MSQSSVQHKVVRNSTQHVSFLNILHTASQNRELQETQARLLEESTWVGSTRMYQALAAEVGRLQELLGVRAKELEALARERDAAHALASERAAAMLVGGW